MERQTFLTVPNIDGKQYTYRGRKAGRQTNKEYNQAWITRSQQRLDLDIFKAIGSAGPYAHPSVQRPDATAWHLSSAQPGHLHADLDVSVEAQEW